MPRVFFKFQVGCWLRGSGQCGVPGGFGRLVRCFFFAECKFNAFYGVFFDFHCTVVFVQISSEALRFGIVWEVQACFDRDFGRFSAPKIARLQLKSLRQPALNRDFLWFEGACLHIVVRLVAFGRHQQKYVQAIARYEYV